MTMIKGERTFAYILITERKNKGYEHRLEDNCGRVHMKSTTPEGINGNPTTTFLVDYAQLHLRSLNERTNVQSIETKFNLDN